MGLNKEKLCLQAELDQAMEALREKLEEVRQLKDLLCAPPRESLSKGQLLARMCVRLIWMQLETNQCNLDEASYLENRSLMNMRRWFSDPERMKELEEDGGEVAKEILQLLAWD